MIRNRGGEPVETNAPDRMQGCIEVILSDGTITAFEEWLDSKGLCLFQMPSFTENDEGLPSYGVTMQASTLVRLEPDWERPILADGSPMPKPEVVVPFKPGKGRPDLEIIHTAIVGIDSGVYAPWEIRDLLVTYVNQRPE